MKPLLLLIFICLTVACANSSAVDQSSKAMANITPANHGAQQSDPSLQTEIEQIGAVARGRVGIAAVVLETGSSVSSSGSEHFPMQSVYKLPISMAVMQQVDRGKLTLEQSVPVAKDDFIGRGGHSPLRDKNPNGVSLPVVDLLKLAISESDGTASDVLMRLAGGPRAVQSYLSAIEINDMKILDTEKTLVLDHSAQYRNWATPESAVALLRALHEGRGLSQSSQKLLLRLMAESTPGKDRLKGELPAGTYVAHKTGTSGTEKGVTAATNDIGIIKLPNGNHLAIAVFVSDSPANQRVREGVIARVAKLLFQRWGAEKA